MDNNYLHIAIDGPVAAGKGDIAARLAKKLGLIYIYTGAMYRALALACIQKAIPFKNASKVLPLLRESRIELVEPDPDSKFSYKVLLNGIDVTERIIDQDVASGASDVSTISEVRQYMVKLQQKIAKRKQVVMEGRDIGLRVLPEAQLKIYLNASIQERAQRRFSQWKAKGLPKTYEETLEDTRQRDLQDTTRVTDPLQKLPDAWELDTTGMTQEQVVNAIVVELQRRKMIPKNY